MMTVLQRSTLVGSEVFVSIRDWFTTKPDEPSPSTSSTTPEPKGKIDESQKPIHPVWNGELDEPIWW